MAWHMLNCRRFAQTLSEVYFETHSPANLAPFRMFLPVCLLCLAVTSSTSSIFVLVLGACAGFLLAILGLALFVLRSRKGKLRRESAESRLTLNITECQSVHVSHQSSSPSSSSRPRLEPKTSSVSFMSAKEAVLALEDQYTDMGSCMASREAEETYQYLDDKSPVYDGIGNYYRFSADQTAASKSDEYYSADVDVSAVAPTLPASNSASLTPNAAMSYSNCGPVVVTKLGSGTPEDYLVASDLNMSYNRSDNPLTNVESASYVASMESEGGYCMAQDDGTFSIPSAGKPRRSSAISVTLCGSWANGSRKEVPAPERPKTVHRICTLPRSRRRSWIGEERRQQPYSPTCCKNHPRPRALFHS